MKNLLALTAIVALVGCAPEPSTPPLPGPAALAALSDGVPVFSAGSELQLNDDGTYVFTHRGSTDTGTYEVLPSGGIALSHVTGPRAGKTDVLVVEADPSGAYENRIRYISPADLAGKTYGFR